jgi:hypothetical protein
MEIEFIQTTTPADNFLILDKRVSEDDRLSLEARAIMIYLLGKPKTWRVIVENLINMTGRARRKAGKHVIYESLKELIDVGYMERRKLPTGDVAYFVHGEPIKPRDYLPGEPDSKNQKQGAEKPDSKNPNLENPNLENPTLVSTEKAVRTESSLRIEAAPEKSSPAQGDLLGEQPAPTAKPAKATKAKTAKPEAFNAMAYLIAAGVDEQVAGDYLTARKKKNLPPTLTAFQKLERDGAAAGKTLVQTVTHCAERGHAGFYPDRDSQAAATNRGSGFMSKQERAEAENRRNHPDLYNQDGTAKVIHYEAPPLAIAQQRQALIGYGQQNDDVGF